MSPLIVPASSAPSSEGPGSPLEVSFKEEVTIEPKPEESTIDVEISQKVTEATFKETLEIEQEERSVEIPEDQRFKQEITIGFQPQPEVEVEVEQPEEVTVETFRETLEVDKTDLTEVEAGPDEHFREELTLDISREQPELEEVLFQIDTTSKVTEVSFGETIELEQKEDVEITEDQRFKQEISMEPQPQSEVEVEVEQPEEVTICLLYTSPSPRDA